MIDRFENEYSFLSNFYESPITIEDITYPTVEHYFQAMKTMDVDTRRHIAAAPSPGRAKQLGRCVDLRPDWEFVKYDVMYQGLSEKFKDTDLRAKLLATGSKKLVEGNSWHDNTWGDCACERCKDTLGRNSLGLLLMKIRDEINEIK